MTYSKHRHWTVVVLGLVGHGCAVPKPRFGPAQPDPTMKVLGRSAQQAVQLLRTRRADARVFNGDESLAHQSRKRVFQRDHSLTFAQRNFADETLQLVIADVIAHGMRGEQHFDGHTAALTVGSGHELLYDDRVEAQSELLLDLRLLRGRKDVDDAMNRLRGVARVQRRQNQMTALGGCQRSGNSLEVAQ